MLRPTTLLPALVAVVATLLAGLPAQAAGHTPAVRAPAAPDTPLSVTIDSLSPSVVPSHGPIRVTGSITNNDDSAWTTVNVFAFMGATPITSTDELAEASKADPASDVGGRITAPGTYDTIDRIAPDQSVQYSVKVPQSAITVTQSGVYWFGVHALGSGPEGRVDGADGRARTFLPLVPRTGRRVDTALVIPLRHTVSYAPDGSVEDLQEWDSTLAHGGRLRSLVDFGAAAGSRPITWLVDPGLPDVVRALTLGNPPRSLTPDLSGGSSSSGSDDGSGSGSGISGSPSPSPEGDGGDSSSGSSSGSGDSGGDDPTLETLAVSGDAWLERLHEALDGSEVLALPYGDIDVSAAAEHDPELYRRARQRSGTQLAPWGLPMSPALGAPGGYIDPSALHALKGRSTVLVSDKMFGGQAPTVARTSGRRLVPTSSGAAAGGPGPDDPFAPVAVRQRILAEAALHLLGDDGPLVVQLPSYWNPSTSTGFFEGLDLDWLHLTTVDDIARRKATDVPPDQLSYPESLDRGELDGANFSSAQALIRAGSTLQSVLTDNETVGSVVADEAMRSTSYGHRTSPDDARAAIDRSRSWIEQELGSIRIDAPPAVTLSSTRGRFAATLTNGLDEPVTVSIQALTDEPMDITGPTTVDIGPGGRRTVLLNASTRTLGVHRVTLVVTDADGVPLGSSDQLPIRSAQVSQVIWLILGTGIALLFGAIAVRLFRRIRAAARAARQTGTTGTTETTEATEATETTKATEATES